MKICISPVFAAAFVESVRFRGNDADVPRMVVDTPVEDVEPVCNRCGQGARKRCANCEKARYCSRDCQRLDWSEHKKVCGSKNSK